MENSSNYSCEPGQWQDEPVMVLRDNQSGAIAMVAHELGSNCVFWAVRHQQQEVPVIETPASPAVLHNRASRGGIPVLWPFPGRVRDAHYTYRGQDYHLPRTDKSGVHHIHGLALNAKWQVAAYGADDNGAFLVTTLRPAQLSDEGRPSYPFDFVLSLRLVLKGQSLTYLVTLENKESQTALPFSFGLHPYFRAPLVPTDSPPDPAARSHCLMRIPAATHWPTDGGIPNGPAQPVTPSQDFRDWKALGSQPFDDMYSGVLPTDGADGAFSLAGYRTPELSLEVQIRADPQFQNWVLFTPAERASIAIEPYTSPPNAINSTPVGLPGSNLLELAAGSSWQAQVIMEVLSF